LHDDSLIQIGRGLAGALIVEEAEPPQVDRELLWTIQDWRLTGGAQIAPGFNNRMEAAMDGRVGNTVTINGREPDAVRVSWSGREPAAAGALNDLARAHTCVALIETAAWLLSERALEAGTEFAFVAGAALTLLSAVLAWGQRQLADGATRRSLGAVAVAATAMAI
jgi:hypothetical protein